MWKYVLLSVVLFVGCSKPKTEWKVTNAQRDEVYQILKDKVDSKRPLDEQLTPSERAKVLVVLLEAQDH